MTRGQLGDNPMTTMKSSKMPQWCGFRCFFNPRTKVGLLGQGGGGFLPYLLVNLKNVSPRESVLYIYKTLVNRASNPMTLSLPPYCPRIRVFVIGFVFGL